MSVRPLRSLRSGFSVQFAGIRMSGTGQVFQQKLVRFFCLIFLGPIFLSDYLSDLFVRFFCSIICSIIWRMSDFLAGYPIFCPIFLPDSFILSIIFARVFVWFLCLIFCPIICLILHLILCPIICPIFLSDYFVWIICPIKRKTELMSFLGLVFRNYFNFYKIYFQFSRRFWRWH